MILFYLDDDCDDDSTNKKKHCQRHTYTETHIKISTMKITHTHNNEAILSFLCLRLMRVCEVVVVVVVEVGTLVGEINP